jgi:hypothetical protein
MRRIGLPLAFAAVFLTLLLVPLPRAGSALWRTAQDAAHGPLFGAAALVILSAIRHAGGLRSLHGAAAIYAVTFAICLVLAPVSELLQTLSATRSASLADVGTDLLGVAAALALHASWSLRHERNWIKVAAAVAIAVLCGAWVLRPVAIAAAVAVERTREFPTLIDFDQALDMRSVAGHGATLRRETWPSDLPASHGPFALRADLDAGTRFPGVELLEPRPDWSDYRVFAMEIGNPTDAPLPFTVRIDDAEHDQSFADRYNGRFKVPPRSRLLVRIPLATVAAAPHGRRLDLAHIDRVLVFRTGAARASVFYLGSVWLEP